MLSTILTAVTRSTGFGALRPKESWVCRLGARACREYEDPDMEVRVMKKIEFLVPLLLYGHSFF